MAHSRSMGIKGKYLDNMAILYGLKRKRYFFFFKESDKSLKERLVKVVERGFI